MSLVERTIEERRNRFLGELSEFLAFQSESGNVVGLENAASWLTNRLTALGATVHALPTNGYPPVIFGEIGTGSRSLLSYSHYDVQPADPLDLWETPPYQATIRDGKLFGRGTSDDKGDTLARIHAVEVYQAVYGELPLRLRFFVEGEEETGSPHLAPLAEKYADLIRSDGVIWEGGGFDEAERYTFYCGLKGIAYLELVVHGPDRDLHSAYAPIVENPAWRLIHAVKTLKDENDRITLDGFMDHVRPPTEEELAYIRAIPFDGAQVKQTLGIRQFLNNLDDASAIERFLTQPTCTICGFRSGFIDEGEKTVLPSKALVKLDFRLVPDLTPELVARLLREHLDRRGYTDVDIVPHAGMVGARSDVGSSVVKAAVASARAIYGHEPVVYPSHGGSGPMFSLVQGLGSNGIMAGVGYPGVQMHAPNENIRVDDYFRHIAFLVEFMRRFSQDG